jgi:hypothetical protein
MMTRVPSDQASTRCATPNFGLLRLPLPPSSRLLNDGLCDTPGVTVATTVLISVSPCTVEA